MFDKKVREPFHWFHSILLGNVLTSVPSARILNTFLKVPSQPVIFLSFAYFLSQMQRLRPLGYCALLNTSYLTASQGLFKITVERIPMSYKTMHLVHSSINLNPAEQTCSMGPGVQSMLMLQTDRTKLIHRRPLVMTRSSSGTLKLISQQLFMMTQIHIQRPNKTFIRPKLM